jgi:hypothetical protein
MRFTNYKGLDLEGFEQASVAAFATLYYLLTYEWAQ